MTAAGGTSVPALGAPDRKAPRRTVTHEAHASSLSHMQDSDILYQWIPMVSGGLSVDAQMTGRAKHLPCQRQVTRSSIRGLEAIDPRNEDNHLLLSAGQSCSGHCRRPLDA